MPQIQDEIYLFQGGLNSDDDEKFLPMGDGDRHNITISGEGENGVLVNSLGNRQVTFPDIIPTWVRTGCDITNVVDDGSGNIQISLAETDIPIEVGDVCYFLFEDATGEYEDAAEVLSLDGDDVILDSAYRDTFVSGSSFYNASIAPYEAGDYVRYTTLLGEKVFKVLVPSRDEEPPFATSNTYFEILGTYANNTNKIIGTIKSYEESAVYVFIYNNYEAHCIFRFNEVDESVDKIVYQEPDLNFSSDTIRFQNGEPNGVYGELIYWNEGYDSNDNEINPPRKINKTLAYNRYEYPLFSADYATSVNDYRVYNDGVYKCLVAFNGGQRDLGRSPTEHETDSNWEFIDYCYEDFSDLEINVIKQPPKYTPRYTYLYDNNRTGNNFRNYFFRFAYRYQYYDDEWSTVSSWSEWSVHEDDLISSNGVSDEYFYNYLSIRFYTGDTYNIKKVQILAEEAGVIGAWNVIKEISLYNNTSNQGVSDYRKATLQTQSRLQPATWYSYNFYNDATYSQIDASAALRLFDNVPKYAGAFNVLEGRLVYGDVTTGYDKVDLDVDVSVGYSDDGVIDSTTYTGIDSITTDVITNDTISCTWDLTQDSINDSLIKNGVWELFSDFYVLDGDSNNAFNVSANILSIEESGSTGKIRVYFDKAISVMTTTPVVILGTTGYNGSYSPLVDFFRSTYVDLDKAYGADESAGSVVLYKYQEPIVVDKYDDIADVADLLQNQLERVLNNFFDNVNFAWSVTNTNTSVTLSIRSLSAAISALSTLGNNSVLYHNYNYINYTGVGYEASRFYGAKLKTGAYHRYSLIYSDNFGRTNGSNGEDDIIAYVKSNSELYKEKSGVFDGFQLPYITLTIKHLPPSWAEKCYLTYTGNSNYDYVQQFLPVSYEDIDLDGTGNNDYTVIALPKSSNYQFQKGDFIRFNYSTNVGSEYKEVDILRVTTTEQIMAIKNAAALADYSSDNYLVGLNTNQAP